MKITINEALVIEKVLVDNKDVKFPAKTSYYLKRLGDKLSPITKQFEQTKNDLVINKYGIQEEKDTYRVPEEKMEDYIKELNELLVQKETIDFSYKFKIEDFDGVELPVTFFVVLEKFIEE
jgi:hypothetical protein